MFRIPRFHRLRRLTLPDTFSNKFLRAEFADYFA